MRVCEDIIVGYDPDDGSAIIEEQCYDDGTVDTSDFTGGE